MDRAPRPVTAPRTPVMRISTSRPIVKLHRARRREAPRTTPSPNSDGTRESLREQLRARLLSLILENERNRRNETRASAS
jgi:hypothetical protein